jgi:hypothetical protein
MEKIPEFFSDNPCKTEMFGLKVSAVRDKKYNYKAVLLLVRCKSYALR